MTYAQKDYATPLGDSGQTIASSGSLITAFSNLLTRFNIDRSPEELAGDITGSGSDPTKLTWAHLSKLYPQLGLYALKNGKPEFSDSIVVFNHADRISYAVVADVSAGTIIDSFDGEEKDWDLYGGPVMYATYVTLDPLVVTPLVASVDTASDPEPAVDTQESHNFDLSADDPIDTTAGIFADEDTTIVPVHKLSASADWKMTLKTGLGVIETYAKEDAVIHDLDGAQPDVQLAKGTIVYVAARFVKDEVPYYRTVDSVNNDHWYGIPAGILSKTDKQQEDDLDNMLESITIDDANTVEPTAREKLIKGVATTEGKVLGIFKRKKKEE